MFTDRLKEVRRDAGLTQNDFASKIGLSRSAYSKYEAGSVNPASRFIKQIAVQFSVNEHWLITGEGDKYTKTKDQQMLASLVVKMLKDQEGQKKDLMLKIIDLEDEDIQTVTSIVKALSNNKKHSD